MALALVLLVIADTAVTGYMISRVRMLVDRLRSLEGRQADLDARLDGQAKVVETQAQIVIDLADDVKRLSGRRIIDGGSNGDE